MASKLVYGIDVGTTKIVAIVGRVDDRRGWSEVLSVGEVPSHGLRRGMVVDREAATESVAAAIEDCGVPLRGGPVAVGIAGGHISSLNTEVTLLNRSRNRTVTERFMKRLEAETRQEVGLEEGEKVIQIVPRSFVLDGTEGVKQPLGLAARSVTMRAHVVAGAVSSIQNLLGAVEDCGVKVSRVVLEPLASSEACLLDEDRSLGVALLDMGGGTTDIATFMRGSLTHTAVIPIGGESFSSDVAYGLKVPFETAEELKKRYGTVVSGAVDDVAAVKLGDLTGGGSLLEGIEQLAEKILDTRVRVVAPRRIKGDSEPVRKPQYSTAVGLLYFAAKNDDLRPKSKGARTTSFDSILSAVKGWFGFGLLERDPGGTSTGRPGAGGRS